MDGACWPAGRLQAQSAASAAPRTGRRAVLVMTNAWKRCHHSRHELLSWVRCSAHRAPKDSETPRGQCSPRSAEQKLQHHNLNAILFFNHIAIEPIMKTSVFREGSVIHPSEGSPRAWMESSLSSRPPNENPVFITRLPRPLRVENLSQRRVHFYVLSFLTPVSPSSEILKWQSVFSLSINYLYNYKLYFHCS